jgi:hypothetical protein
MRLVGLARKERPKGKAAPAVVAQHNHHRGLRAADDKDPS